MEQNNISDLMKKLDMMYQREEEILKEAKILYIEYKQLQEDKELMQNIIMHTSNKSARKMDFREWQNKMMK